MKIKQIILLCVFLVSFSTIKAQNDLPNTFNYQAVINAEDGSPVANKDITVEITVLQNETEIYQELQQTKTNDFGLFSVEIGNGNPVFGNYKNINWLNVENGYYYLHVRADFGESEFLNGMNDLGKSKFSAVPYSLVALSCDKTKGLTDDNTVKLNDLSDVEATPEDGQILAWNATDGKWVAVDKPTGGSTGGVEKLSELSDVTVSSLAGNEFLKYNGTKWINSKLELSFSSLSDYKAVSPLKNGMIMTYNSTTEKWEAKDKDDEGCLWEEKVSTKEDGSKIYQLWPTNTSAAVCIGNSSNNITISRDKISLPTGNITLGTASISANNCIAGGSTLIQESSDNSIAFGESSSIIGKNSLVIGKGCVAEGNQSAAIGEGSWTKMNAQFVCGKYNKFDATSALFIVGNGSGTADDARSTAFYVTEGGKAFVQGGVELSSDSRMKTNVNTIGTALDNVLKLRGVTFYWDKTKIPSSSDNLQYGFIAQEVEKIFPDLVTTDSNGYKTMNYIGVIPVLTEAVKELKKENEELKSTLEDLLKRVEALENK
ncbi:MAG: tail fiber domain-containing protein [Bacteroidales bacterium]|nr:tail fiber domain-containing protein [Bacteroidales bacterium]